MKTVGEQPRPRALVWMFDKDDAAVAAAEFATAKIISDPSEVHQGEWDVVVTDISADPFESHLFRICFGAQTCGTAEFVSERWRSYSTVHFDKEETRESIFVNVVSESEIGRLVDDTLIRLARSRAVNPLLSFSSFTMSPSDGGIGSRIEPLLTTNERKVLAAYIRHEKGSETLCLPPGVSKLRDWTRAALIRWHSMDPVRFPTNPGWQESEEWFTKVELEALSRLRDAEDQLNKSLEQARLQVKEREDEVRAARIAASSGWAVLLLGRGEELVELVTQALVTLGFTVTDQDQVNPPNDRLEDLRVTSNEHPDWVALAEVRGYAKGAAQSDLLRLSGRFARRYVVEAGKEPTALWYVVNHFLNEDPGRRPEALAGNDREVDVFREEGGLIIDTRDLFRAIRDVEGGKASQDEVRTSLVEATGRWKWSPQDAG